MNDFIQDLSKSINDVSESNRKNYFLHKVDSFLKKHDDIETQNIITNLLSKNILNHIEKIKYKNNDSDIVLITQYYNAKDEHRFKENLVCLINNIVNENISKVCLLNEEEYDLSFVFDKIGNNYRKKVKQSVIETRMTFLDAFNYANTFLKNKIVIIANLDIFFNDTINLCKKYDFNNLFISLSRYDLQADYNFDGSNTINKFSHQGGLGNPVIDSADSWIFQTPIKTCSESKIMLGSAGCDTILNYLYKYNLKYNVINPVNSIVSIHYHLDQNRQNFTDNLDENRISVSTNLVRNHSDGNYNSDNSFHPNNYNHCYLLQKNIVLCNEIESFCTFATKGAYSDLKLLLKSLELYHKDIPIFILCDKWTNDQIDEDNYDLKIYKRIDLEKYCNMNREIMEKNNLFTEFLLKKCDTIDYAMSVYSNTLFIDGDIVLFNKFDLMIDINYDVGLSPHNIFEKTSKKFGIYNAGFMYIKNKTVTQFWRHKVNTCGGFVDQQALDYFKDEFNVYEFDDSYNYGWWRLFQCDDPQSRVNLFSIDDTSIYYEYKTLKCVHTHFYQQHDNQTIQFNQFIIGMLDKIKHPMLKYILNQNNNQTKLPVFIIPKQPRDDFWNHNNDTFRELLYMWSENNLCSLKEEDTKHVWYNAIGDILLYDRPTLEWIQNDSNLTVNKILFGNPSPPKKLLNISSSWIFWGRHPRTLEQLSEHNLNYSSRRIETIFIGKCENKIQEHFRLNQNWGNYIQVYKMHKTDENYIYSQNEYLQLLKNSKFGISLRGFGPKCNREIELMAFGTVPIIDNSVSMDYYDSPKENIHYFKINNPSDIKEIVKSCSQEKWNQMSVACINWYKKNCSTKGSFQTTMNAIKDLINKPNKNVIQQNSSYEDVYSLKNTYVV